MHMSNDQKVTVRISKDMQQALRDLGRKRGTPRSQLIRLLIEEGLAKHGPQQTNLI